METKIALVDIQEELLNVFFSPSNDLLKENHITVCDESEADILISDHLNELGIKRNAMIRKMLRYGKSKKYLIWTTEPRFSKSFRPCLHFPGLPPLHFLNVYTGLLSHNFLWGPRDMILSPLDEFSFKNRTVVALMRYRNNQKEWTFKHQGKELDLCFLRTQIALEGYQMEAVDVYGQGWGKMRKGVSRTEEDYEEKKQEVLKNYHFNLAFENTNYPYYCTEKIWDAIQGGCLPIYYGQGNAIYEDFPPNSFIDYCDFNNAKDLFSYIQNMSSEEFMTRMNLCINTFNECIEKRRLRGDRMPMWELTVKKIKEIAES